MALKYTTAENIARRLIGRLEFTDPTATPNPWGSNLGSQKVNPELVEQLAKQKEAYVDSILNVIYEMPLQLVSDITKGVLADIIESFVVADLMKIHYLGNSTAGLSADVAGAAVNDRQHAEFMLQVYCTGHGIQFPGMSASGSSPGITLPQPVMLPGEKLRSNPSDSITRNDTRVGKRNQKTGTAIDKIDWGV